MTIKSAVFFKCIKGTDPILYDGKPQIAFVGRSNVGKSSVINSLVHQKIARSSKTPGKTKNLDFFLINNSFYFVDLPGYGFAKRSSDEREQFRKMMLWYFQYSEVKQKLVIVIIDGVVGCTDFDYQMYDLLSELHIPFVIVVNKVDKLKMGIKEKQLNMIQKDCRKNILIPYSTVTGEGKTSLLHQIGAAL